MKKIAVLVSVLCLLAVNSYALTMKVSDLEKCLSLGTSGQITQYLTSRGWYYYSQEIDENGGYGKLLHTSWAYWYNREDRYSDKANAWVSADITKSGNGKISLLVYQCFNMEDFSPFAKSLELSNYKFIRSIDHDEYGDKKDSYIRSIYQNQNNIIWVESYKDEYEIEDQEWVDGHWTSGYDNEYDYYTGQYKRVWKEQKDYVRGYYKTVKKKRPMTHWTISISPREGRLDVSNGHKKYYRKDVVIDDYQLKDDYLINEFKTYFANGKPYEILHINSNSWVVDKYDYRGNKISSLTISSKGLQKITQWKDYYFQANGTYVEYEHDLRRGYDADYAPNIDKKYEGVFNIRIFVTIAGIYITKSDSLNGNDKYTLTEYEYDSDDNIKSKSVTLYNKGKETETLVYDDKNRLIEKYTYHGELTDSHSWDYDENSLVEERIEHYINEELEGKCVTTNFLPNGIKIVKTENYKQGELDGDCFQESFINGKRQVDSYSTYVNGKLHGKILGIQGDSVLYSVYNNGEMQSLRVFRDDMMQCRSPKYILTDTTKLTLVAEITISSGKPIGLSKFYYPGYYVDTIKMIKGKHAGELEYTIDYTKGITTVYSEFGTKYDDSTYESYILESHIDPETRKKNGTTTYKDSIGNLIYIKNYKDNLLDGLSKYYHVSFCDGEYQAFFDKGIWTRSKYKQKGGYLIEIQKISLSQISVITYNEEEKMIRKDFYIVNTKTLNSFNQSNWVNVFAANDTYKTDEFYTYDEEGRVRSYRNKDSNFIVYNNYDQYVTYWVHKAKAVPDKYYELNSNDYMTGTITLDIDEDTYEIIKIKNGYRDGITKVVDNKTGKVIRKIKYSKGIAK